MARPGKRPRKLSANRLFGGLNLPNFGAETRFSGPVCQERTSSLMAESRKLGFGPISALGGGVVVAFIDDNLRFGPRTRSVLGSAADMVARAAKAERFTGKSGTVLDIVAPHG